MPQPAALARSAWRALCLLVLLMIAVLMALAVRLSPQPLDPDPLMAWWFRQLLGLLRVRVRWDGAAPDAGGLIVANHVSWLDIAVIGSRLPGRFVAKSELREWPLLGALAESAGCYFIHRGRHASSRLNERMAPRLHTRGRIILFPEGTTTDGNRVRRFHARLFAGAVSAEARIQPLALHYAATSDGRALAPFVGEDAFLPHLLRLLGVRELQVQAQLTPALRARNERGALAREARAAVIAALAELQGQAGRAAPTTHSTKLAISGQRAPQARGAR